MGSESEITATSMFLMVENGNTTHLCLKDTCQGIADPALAPPTIRSVAEKADFIHDGTLAKLKV